MGDVATRKDGPLGPDPRPRTVPLRDVVLLRGWRCDSCELPRAVSAPRCPDCGGELIETDFGPAGTIWSSTIVHLDLAEISAPYGLAYVDLDDGPRFLAHTIEATSPIAVGTRVTITGTTPGGDIQVAPIDRGIPT